MITTDMVNRFPEWFFIIVSILFIIAITVGLWYAVLGAKKFQDTMNRESSIIELKDKVSSLEEELFYHKGLSQQLHTSMLSIQQFLLNYNKMKIKEFEIDSHNHLEVMQRLVDSLASDIKSNTGDRHRCGIWMESEKELTLIIGSSEFPMEYLHVKKLDIDHTIGGKAYRQNRLIHLLDVRKDSDWKENVESTFKYNSMVAIPLSSFGVLTIDAIHPIKKELVCVIQAYARLIEIVFLDFVAEKKTVK